MMHPASVRAPASLVHFTFVSDTVEGAQDGRFDYAGDWQHVRDERDGRLFGTSSRSNRPGALVTLRFVGSLVRIYGVRGRNGGYALVTLDGAPVAEVSFFSGEKQSRALVYASPLLLPGEHRIELARAEDRRATSVDRRFINISGAVYR